MTTGRVTVDDLRTMLEQGRPVTVLDVRDPGDAAEWRIPGAVQLDVYDAIAAKDAGAIASVEVPKDRPVVAVCYKGVMSRWFAERLRERGVDAASLDGGMGAWSLAWNTADVPLFATEATVVQVRRTGKGCLSYMVGSRGEAAVIDASVGPDVYMGLAKARGWRITNVLETHVHADHVSRARALCAATGSTLVMPGNDRVSFQYKAVKEGDTVQIGGARLRVLHTPGHTPESVCYDLDGRALFTGDTLFGDSIGRPDLEASPEEARARAHLLYGSLQRLTRLDPGTLVLPAHTSRPVPFDRKAVHGTVGGAAKGIAVLARPEDGFVETILGKIPPTPPNHHAIVKLNEAGASPPANVVELEAGANRCAVM